MLTGGVLAFIALNLTALHIALAAPVISVDGTVHDAIAVGNEIWLSTSDARGRRLVRIDRDAKPAGGTVAVAKDAIFVDACPDGRVVYADARGLVAANGTRLVDARALFTVPDPTALLAADLCGKSGDGRDELRVPVVDGLLVLAPGKAPLTLKLAHDARAYSGRVHRGLRPDRGYAEALSLYGPRLFDVDVDGDEDTDLVAVRESRLTVWKREGLAASERALVAAPAAERDLQKVLGVGDEADLRVRLVDVDGDRRSDAVVGVTRGAIPDKSEAWLLSSAAGAPFAKPTSLWRRAGLVAAIGQRGKELVVAELDTSLVSLSGVVLTGRIAVKVSLEELAASAAAAGGRATAASPLVMQAKVDVRAGRMDGALPVVTVDFDGDGTLDLLDLGVPGSAAWHRGTPSGWSLDADATLAVPTFVHVVAMPELAAVVLVGAPKKGRTPVAVLTTTKAPATAAPRARSNCDPVLDLDCERP